MSMEEDIKAARAHKEAQWAKSCATELLHDADFLAGAAHGRKAERADIWARVEPLFYAGSIEVTLETFRQAIFGDEGEKAKE